MSNSLLDKIKSGIKNSTEVTLNLSSNERLVSLTMRLIFYINYYWSIEKFQGFVKLMWSILLSTLRATLLRNLLTDKGVKTKAPKEGDIKAAKEQLEPTRIFYAAKFFGFFWKYFQNQPKLSSVYSRND